MKRLLLLTVLLGFAGLQAAQAQCPSSKAKAQTANVQVCQKMSAAAKAASLDPAIERRVCAQSGQVAYVRKEVCQSSGTVSYAKVEYCTRSQRFVNASPRAVSQAAAKSNCPKACCEKDCQIKQCQPNNSNRNSNSNSNSKAVRLVSQGGN